MAQNQVIYSINLFHCTVSDNTSRLPVIRFPRDALLRKTKLISLMNAGLAASHADDVAGDDDDEYPVDETCVPYISTIIPPCLMRLGRPAAAHIFDARLIKNTVITSGHL